ncbi:hypothetical protein FACS1894164_07660 [Spirochaetia bacterium]|nr:hypothetical protein FACS1894164_07660 [Spirochaetia bacterium]
MRQPGGPAFVPFLVTLYIKKGFEVCPHDPGYAMSGTALTGPELNRLFPIPYHQIILYSYEIPGSCCVDDEYGDSGTGSDYDCCTELSHRAAT